MFSNTLFSSAKSEAMKSDQKHPTFERLLSVSEAAGLKGPTALAAVLEQSEQAVNNWSRRGVSRAGAIAAQQKLGCASSWVLDGVLPRMVTDEPPAHASPLTVLIKRLSHELQNVEAANRPLIAHAIKTWADAPDQWELLVQQLRNLGVNAGMEPPEPKREAPVTAPTLSTGYFKGRTVYGDDQVPERRATPGRRNLGGA